MTQHKPLTEEEKTRELQQEIIVQLREERKKEDDQATETLKDYQTTATYIGAGGLGFFLTIHEKFFQMF